MSKLETTKLESGYWLISGHGPCEWAQPPTWPCDEATLRDYAGMEASEQFFREAMKVVEACNG
jgi:hypothetical protein